eukprot:GILI01018423.1.p1 GENE.GILI01018423.1~~GILI01018423.1.p1  ORF type:complete len:109 (-),score=0.13 GILI01018423.1:32-358(-)
MPSVTPVDDDLNISMKYVSLNVTSPECAIDFGSLSSGRLLVTPGGETGWVAQPVAPCLSHPARFCELNPGRLRAQWSLGSRECCLRRNLLDTSGTTRIEDEASLAQGT